jgi:hypothetical protein
MIMPMFSITGADNNNNPTRGTISVNFSPTSVPTLQSLQQWMLICGCTLPQKTI